MAEGVSKSFNRKEQLELNLLDHQIDDMLVHREAHPLEEAWTIMQLYPEELVRGTNIRPRDEKHVKKLALSIITHGQQQPGIGDTLQDGRIRLDAGNHRLDAVLFLNERSEAMGLSQRHTLEVRVSKHEFTVGQRVGIMLAENLQHPMTRPEKADTIAELWRIYTESGSTNKAEFARLIGRSRKEIYDALRFHYLHPLVQDLVRKNALEYEDALKLSKLPVGSLDPANLAESHQIVMANRIVLWRLRGQAIDEQIRAVLAELPAVHVSDDPQLALLEDMEEGSREASQGLFTLEMYSPEEDRNRATRQHADKAGQEVALYLKRVLNLIKTLPDPHDARLSNVLENNLMELLTTVDGFLQVLYEFNPDLASELVAKMGIIQP